MTRLQRSTKELFVIVMPIIKNSKIPVLHKVIITAISSLLVLMILWPSTKQEPTVSHPNARYEIGKSYPVPMQAQSLSAQEKIRGVQPSSYLDWRTFKIRSGESLAVLFSRVGIHPTVLHRLIETDKHTKKLASLKIGDEIQLGFDEQGVFTQLIQPKNIDESLVVTLINNKFESKIEKKKIDHQISFASATITSNFWNASTKAGLQPNQIMELATIFGWDIDFALDIRKGDSFSVLYEERLIEGQIIDQGNILAATFINQGDKFTAIRTESGQYYDEEGRAMRKTFLRSPVNFRYVSSNFNPIRQHPVTGKVTAHNGTDYVAPVGTPIWAAGNGTVIESAYNQFNGNYVFIRHNSTYVTKYLHLTKRFVKTGERVKQGEKIGSLGGTGRVTGPHLHYEFLVNGVHKNPRTVQLPKSNSLSGQQRKEFMLLAQNRLEKLNKFHELLASLGNVKRGSS